MNKFQKTVEAKKGNKEYFINLRESRKRKNRENA